MTTKYNGIQIDQMDLSANPGVDFNRYCNGKWLDSAVIPQGYASWGGFMQLRDKALDYLRDLFEKLATAGSVDGSNKQKIGDLYASGMNEAQIEAEGLTSLTPYLTRIGRIRNLNQLTDAVAQLHSINSEAFFGFGGGADYDDSDRMIAHASQGGTGLERDYYLKTDKDTVEKREQYQAHVQRMLELLGTRPATAKRHADAILKLETQLASISMDIEARRDPNKNNNKMTLSQFQALCPNLPLSRYFSKLGAPAFEVVNVRQPDFFKGLNVILAETPMWVVRAYLRFHLLSGLAAFLPKAVDEENFRFYSQVMKGTKEQQVRWKRICDVVSGLLGEAVGEIYVGDNFPPAAKALMLELNDAMKEALREMFSEMVWLSKETREYAIKKLDAFVCNIGYPDKWRDYTSLTIDRTSFAGNVLRCARFGVARNLNKIGGAVDKGEWGMTPQTVNAQCSQSKNMTFFPAAIFQLPFFSMLAHFAFNLGAIGAVIGHENWHNFDDKGSKFGLLGNLFNWWLKQDEENFDLLMKLIKDLYSSFVVVEAAEGKDAVHMKGGLVCGEAISDLMGLRIAFRAMQKMVAKYGPTVDEYGFNDEQRFFIAFGQLWATISLPTYQVWQANNDPHPIARFRVIGTLSNMPEFRKAFNLTADSPMVLPEHLRCDLLAGPRR